MGCRPLLPRPDVEGRGAGIHCSKKGREEEGLELPWPGAVFSAPFSLSQENGVTATSSPAILPKTDPLKLENRGES